MALAVVELHQRSDFPVSRIRQIFHGPFCRKPVVQGHMGQLQLSVITVDEKNGNAALHQRFDQRKVGIWQAAFGCFHDDSRRIVPADDILQNDPFPFQLIVGERDLNGIASLKQIILDSLNGFGKNITVHIGGNHGNPRPIFQRCPAVVDDISTAAAAACQKLFLFQNAERMPYRLPGKTIFHGQLVLRVHLLSRFQFSAQDLFPQEGRKLEIFRFLFQNPTSSSLSASKLYYIIPEVVPNICTFFIETFQFQYSPFSAACQ